MAARFYNMKVIGGFRKKSGGVMGTESRLIWTEEPVRGENSEQRQRVQVKSLKTFSMNEKEQERLAVS